jgi:hypothetical protein
MKVCREHPKFVKNGQKYRAPSMKTAGCYTVAKSLLHNAQYSYTAVICSSTLHTECTVAFPIRQCLRDALQCHVSKGKLAVQLLPVRTFCFVTIPTTRHRFSCKQRSKPVPVGSISTVILNGRKTFTRSLHVCYEGSANITFKFNNVHFPCNYIIFTKNQYQIVALYYLFAGYFSDVFGPDLICHLNGEIMCAVFQ